MVIIYPGSREDLGDSKTVSATANMSSGHCPAQPKINQGKENLMPAAMAKSNASGNGQFTGRDQNRCTENGSVSVPMDSCVMVNFAVTQTSAQFLR